MALRRSSRALALFTLLVCAGAALCPSASGMLIVRHGQKRDAQAQIEQLEEQWRTAELAGDATAMDKLLADDYVGISMNGQVNTKQQQLDRLRSHAMVLTRIDQSEEKFKLVGKHVAIVTSLFQVEGTFDGAPVSGLFRSTRVYQRVGPGAWKMTNFEATRVPGDGHGRAGQPDPAAAHTGT